MCSSRPIKPTSVKPLLCSFLEGTSPRSTPRRRGKTRKNMRTVAILAVTSLCWAPLAHGQSIATVTDAPQPRTYHLLREDDDWTFLAAHSPQQDVWDPIKYIRLRQGRDA